MMLDINFLRQKNKLINRIRNYSCKLLFPITFIDTFKTTICVYNSNSADTLDKDAPKIYNYLNEYNSLIIETRAQLEYLENMSKWGLLFNSYVAWKIKFAYLIKMFDVYTNLIIRNVCIKKTNRIYDYETLNNHTMLKKNIHLFMKIHKFGNKYILIDGVYISSVTPLFIDTLFPSKNYIRPSLGCIRHKLHECDQLDLEENID